MSRYRIKWNKKLITKFFFFKVLIQWKRIIKIRKVINRVNMMKFTETLAEVEFKIANIVYRTFLISLIIFLFLSFIYFFFHSFPMCCDKRVKHIALSVPRCYMHKYMYIKHPTSKWNETAEKFCIDHTLQVTQCRTRVTFKIKDSAFKSLCKIKK